MLHDLTIFQIHNALKKKQFSVEELTTNLLTRIKKLDVLINSVISLTEEEALLKAKLADKLIAKKGKNHILLGIPIGHKDIFCTKGIKTSCGSKMLENFISPYNATIVEKLSNVGCITLCKLNMDEFAMGSSNESSYYGQVKNPWNLEFIPGGSSGGSAAAVAARFIPVATGSDTGGSIRQPAAFTNLTGIKPTYGLVSRWGMIAYASSFDQAGPLARNAEDCSILLNIMAGFDSKDSTSIKRPREDYLINLKKSLTGVRIGLPKEYFSEELNSNIANIIFKVVKELQKLGSIIKEISLPHFKYAIPTYYVLALVEASSNLARFDGIRFGYRCSDPKNILDLYERSRMEGFGWEVKNRIIIGTYLLSSYYSYYVKAQKIRSLIKNDFINAFKDVDIILGPTTPNLQSKLGERDYNCNYIDDIYTITANLTGMPGLSMPAGFINGLPVGVQLLASYFKESLLLNVAYKYQQISNWHNYTPNEF